MNKERMKQMRLEKKLLIATGLIASVGGVAWFLTQTEKGRQLSQKAKEKAIDVMTPDYQIKEYTFVFKEPYDYEKEPYNYHESSLPNGQVLECTKKETY